MKFLWKKLKEVDRPWMLIGDFNCVLKEEERSSNSGTLSSFESWVEYNGLLYVGYSGNKFTWSHGVNMETRKAARLDKAPCCVDGGGCFPWQPYAT